MCSTVIVKQPNKPRGITATLKTATLFLSITFTLIIGTLGSLYSFKSQQQIAYHKQKSIAQNAANQVACYIQEKYIALETTAGLIHPKRITREEQERLVSRLLHLHPAIRQLVVLGLDLETTASVSRLTGNASHEIVERFGKELLNSLQRENGRVNGRARYISPVYMDDGSLEPLVVMAVLIGDISGEPQGALIAEVNLKFIWDLVSGLKVGTGSAYVVDRQGKLIAFRDVSRVLQGESLKRLKTVEHYMRNSGTSPETEIIESKGIGGNMVLGTYVPLGMPDWAVVTELPLNEAYCIAYGSIVLTVAFTAFIAVLSYFSSTYLARRIIKPLENLMSAVTRITAGEMELQAAVEGPAEVAGLAEAFNSMTARLREVIGSLEAQSRHLMTTVQQYVNFMAQVGQGNLKIRLTLNKPETANDPLTFLGYQLNETTSNLEQMIEKLQDANNRIIKRETELQMYAGKLQKSNAELEQFAYVASHDLQEPLRKIRMFNDKLQEILKDVLDERTRDYLKRMNNAAIRMEKLITDLLTYSRVTTHAKPYQPVNLNETIKEVLADLEVCISDSKAQIVADDLPVIDADPVQMRQLFQNLIGNAIKYRRPGVPPVIRIESRTVTSIGEPDYYRIDVIDNGIGFDNAYAQRIFGLFQRLHGRDQYEGTGLGLAISKKIVLEHGGAITASGKPDEGATITLRFPVKRGE